MEVGTSIEPELVLLEREKNLSDGVCNSSTDQISFGARALKGT